MMITLQLIISGVFALFCGAYFFAAVLQGFRNHRLRLRSMRPHPHTQGVWIYDRVLPPQKIISACAIFSILGLAFYLGLSSKIEWPVVIALGFVSIVSIPAMRRWNLPKIFVIETYSSNNLLYKLSTWTSLYFIALIGIFYVLLGSTQIVIAVM